MKVGDLASSPVIAVHPGESLRGAAESMMRHHAGSTLVLDDGELVGILTERDILRAVATRADLDGTGVGALMTTDVVLVGADWEVYEATAEMAARHIRHLVVTNGGGALGVLSVRDVLLAGQRIELGHGAEGDPRNWAVLRDPLTFTVRERRRLQRYLLMLRDPPPSEFELAGVIELLVESWSFGPPPSADAEAIRGLPAADYELLRAAVISELPDLQRAVHPSPGWRRR
jgi:CBS domain-containing protein